MALDVLEQIQEQCRHDDLVQQEHKQEKKKSEGMFVPSQQLDEVDDFLREAVNSRNRITVLRLEQDIERFSRNQNQYDLLLKPMQSSYERLAAHRIAQHYGLQSMVVTASFPKVSRILLVKTPNSKLPSIRLADIPVEGAVSEKSVSLTNERIAIMQRERTTNVEGLNGSAESGRTPPKTMEEREVEYDKARARIFSSDAASAVNGDDIVSDELDMQKMLESSLSSRIQTSQGGEGKNQHVSSNRVAIFRDREKDMKDPDYDRSYKRYVQPLEPSTSAIFATLYRMYSPVNNMYDKYNRFNGPWSPQGQVDQPTYMPAVHFRGPRVDSSYPDISYVHYGQGHSDAYWQCQRFPAHMAQYAQLKDGSPQSFQHGLQLPTSLGTLGR